MSTLAIVGWTKGCDTVAAMKCIRDKSPMPLNEAHGVMNRVLRDERVLVDVSDPFDADRLIEALEKFGLIAIPIAEPDRWRGEGLPGALPDAEECPVRLPAGD